MIFTKNNATIKIMIQTLLFTTLKYGLFPSSLSPSMQFSFFASVNDNTYISSRHYVLQSTMTRNSPRNLIPYPATYRPSATICGLSMDVLNGVTKRSRSVSIMAMVPLMMPSEP